MTASLQPPIPATGTPSERLVEFPDNRLLIDLCGEYDRNLADIETKLDVQILRRGNQLAVIGETGATEDAVGVLSGLYERLEAGRDLEQGDIDRAIRMGPAEDAPGADAGEQLEMFKGGRVEIKTRKKLVEPRTGAQKSYVTNLFSHDLAFGIGPAGTGKTYLAVAVGCRCSSPARSTASSCRARPSRPASGWASCPAT